LRRITAVLTVSAIMLIMLVSSLALPALAQGEPREPRCGWYYYEETRQWDDWWEYWCRYPDWGWEFVFWVWAD
jgi:hypothetical protein